MAKYSGYTRLRNKWVNRHQEITKKLWTRHKDSLDWLREHSKKFAVGSAAAALLVASPISSNITQPQASAFQTVEQIGREKFLSHDLKKLLPAEMRELTLSEEEKLASRLTEDFGIPIKVGINGIRLNRTYGLIGQEQHLARFPGDTVANHEIQKHGMAPGLGAWGYFGSDEKAALREKYYIAVPTFMAPGFLENVAEYRDFFKFRKMILINPENGKAIIAVVGDAGPATWTGKHLGGSPEVMHYLERVDRTPVVYFFVDDPDDKIPLGPISLVNEK